MGRIIEQGDIFFFYRPRVDATEVDELEDVARFFLILRPDGKARYRRLVVGRKRLPDPREHEREWAFVDEVVERPDELREELGQHAYETKTRGPRIEPEARPVGEGRYAIVEHGDHTHLTYVLELPREPGRAQDAFRIRPEASYVIAVRNPEVAAPPGVGLRPGRRANYPPDLMERFGHRRFASLGDPRFLDVRGAELVLIGAAEDVEEELGIRLEPEDERVETADVFRKLRLPREDRLIEPLTRGDLR
jgi:hypothetical protein